MEQLSAHLGNSEFVSILIDAPKDKKNIRPLLIAACLKTSKRKPHCNPPSPTQSIAPGVSRRPLGRWQLQPAVGQTCIVLAVTAQSPGQEEGWESRKIRQDEAGGRGVQGRKTGVVGSWERELFPQDARCDRATWQTLQQGRTSGSGDFGPGQTLPSASPGALAY